MSENLLNLMSINELMKYSFYIPSYQRGYRWTETQVVELLEDIWDFELNRPSKVNNQPNPFYCLQPIVVKPRENGSNEYEVIDGQQRLITIFLILKNLENLIDKKTKNIQRIWFETRNQSEVFLKDIGLKVDEKEANENIDYYHIYQAYQTIIKWFENKAEQSEYASPRAKFITPFLSHTKVIWYEVRADSDSYDIFTRLNSGKIQLTNAELVKALFLKKWNNAEEIDTIRLKQLQIATEWNQIENRLQDDTFWYFIYNEPRNTKSKYDNRIEYIFDLMHEKPEGAEDKYTFYKFLDSFEKSKNATKVPDTDSLWLEVKKYFLTFEEWYNNRELYHLIGYLIAIGHDIQDIIKLHTDGNIKSKSEFKNQLNIIIRDKLNFDIRQLRYDYSKDKAKIKFVLLLFNIQTILDNEKSTIRFPFSLYKIQDWDIEHVRSRTDKNISGNKRSDWAKDILEYFSGSDEEQKQRDFISNLPEDILDTIKQSEKVREVFSNLHEVAYNSVLDDNMFSVLYKQMQKEFRENEEPEIDEISNLALLDSSTNKSYKNEFFSIKRSVILRNDQRGTFIPICTKNVFMKAYSKRFSEVMFWNRNDAQAYLEAIESTIKKFLPQN